jgi:putative transcriptional regulator
MFALLSSCESFEEKRSCRRLENWEQERAKPNAQAALLINLVKRYPNTAERLAAL